MVNAELEMGWRACELVRLFEQVDNSRERATQKLSRWGENLRVAVESELAGGGLVKIVNGEGSGEDSG